ncbi:MAG: hypothetical protein E7040_03150 [Lentisphaerae bacterium]|nr:hypothetical protein [Lentisphaerota bacterium]
MKKILLGLLFCGISTSIMAAYQYNVKGNQGWLTFDGETTVAFDLTRESRKDKDNGQDNYIDRGNGAADYGWYNLDTGEKGSFSNGAAATFTEKDRIGFWVKDNTGKVYVSTKPEKNADSNVIWGKSREIADGFSVAGGNFGSNGTQEYYVLKINKANSNKGNAPSGQPLPGILAVLAAGGVAFGATKLYLNKKKGKDKK